MQGKAKKPDWKALGGQMMKRQADKEVVRGMNWEAPVAAQPWVFESQGVWNAGQVADMPGAYTLTTSTASPSTSYTASSLIGARP